jgi:biotin-dependent carboxylase-like uncharacterized protein
VGAIPGGVAVTPALEVLRTGPLALVQDRGRPGLAHLGVTDSGAADRRAHDLANRLVANPADRATVEITLGGFTARIHGETTVTVTGAQAETAVNGEPFGLNSIRAVHDGDVVTVGMATAGVRCYLAVRGGVDVPPVLGSRSHDVLAGLGPPPLHPGDVLPVGRPGARFPDLDQAPVASVDSDGVDVTVVRGPRDDWFVDPGLLVRASWRATDRTDRVGIRLAGPALTVREPGRQLPSEGLVRGAIQVPPNGFPVILGADHPVTGGYPVIGVVVDRDTDLLAQVRPGQRVRLHWSRPRAGW